MKNLTLIVSLLAFITTSCSGTLPVSNQIPVIGQSTTSPSEARLGFPPTREVYEPGELVDYVAQSGDTLPSLASHFNTSVDEIRAANPIIPLDATTMPAGLPMKMPIYYLPLWGTSHQIIPDSHFVYGPVSLKKDIGKVITNGWLNNYREPRPEGNLTSQQIITQVSQHFSVSPMVLVLFIEGLYEGTTNTTTPDTEYLFGYNNPNNKGVYMQLVWLANELNNGYYGWRGGTLKEFEFPDGHIERPDPWQNAGTVGIQYALSKIVDYDTYQYLVNEGGFSTTYSNLFGDPWADASIHIEGSLQQPPMALPFSAGKVWNYTGGPHTGWGEGQPFAAIDFAPSGVKGCSNAEDWVTAVADGVIVRTGTGEVWLDLDRDGLEQTGWVIFYLHLSNIGQLKAGQKVVTGQNLGLPSCEGGTSTGTHVHIARKYNGEWILADSVLPFNMDGWIVRNGSQAYKGSLVRNSLVVTASSKAEGFSAIEADQ